MRFLAFFFHKVQHRSLEPTEAKVIAIFEPGAGKAVASAVTFYGELLYGGAAGVAQPQDPGHLIEGFAGGIISGSPQELIAAMPLYKE